MYKWFRKQPITLRGAIITIVGALFVALLTIIIDRLWPVPPSVVLLQNETTTPGNGLTQLFITPEETPLVPSPEASIVPATQSMPYSSPIPDIYLNYTIPGYAIGPGRVDLLRLHNSSSSSVSVVSFGAVISYQGKEVVVKCDEGICIPSSSYPEPISYSSVWILPEELFFLAPGAPTPDPVLIYPQEVPPGAADFASKISVHVDSESESLPENATVAPFLVLSDGSIVIAPPVVAVILGSFR